ncbi:MAG: DASS family sodium-coupled anion symporter, partial [Myxococcota bacterium]|nr:DASS family sodium-coupled anion symporter [Myxococcota bacterium]
MAVSETHFEIDRRSILVVLASRLRRQLVLIALLALFAWIRTWPIPDGLTESGWGTLCIFGLCASLWATGTLPPAITSLLALALLPMLGIMGARETYAYFGSRVVFFILGAFMLSAALVATGLSQRLATVFVQHVGQTPKRLVLGIFALCAATSTLMSSHAVAVMMFPLVQDLARALELKPKTSRMGRSLMFALAWGCIIGGSFTILGGGRGPLAIGLLEEASQETMSISFLGYMSYSWPLVASLLLFALWRLSGGFATDVEDTSVAVTRLKAQLHEMGKVSPQELSVGAVLVITVTLWAVAGDTLGIASIAICSMAALFALGTVSWHDIQTRVNWGIVVMYGGAIGLGGAMERSGAASWLTEQTIGGFTLAPTTLMLGLAVASAVLTEFMSNSAVVAMLMPPALALAETHGIDLRAMTMAIVLPSNFAFIFPIATPVTALAWSGGYFSAGVMAKEGVVMHAFAWTVMASLIYG